MQIETNQDRLWSTLMELGKLGETDKGGCNRVEFTVLNKEARDRFCSWARDAGCQIVIDGFGNIRARRQGKNPDAPTVMCGSHLDTQPTGGKFDGVYGVLGGLEAIRALNDAGAETEATIEVVVWTNEEGYIFQTMMCSAFWTGMIQLKEAL
jgi:N-carbamoyl-L-amino-acid hydrolase